MKHSPSLRDERDALLEQIHASRATYRRMLAETDASDQNDTESHGHNISIVNKFPRSMTMQWIKQHPYLTASAAAAVLLIAPRVVRAVAKRTAAMNRRSLGANFAGAIPPGVRMNPNVPAQNTGLMQDAGVSHGGISKGAATARAVLTSLAAIATMVLRDPTKMRMAARIFSIASGFVQRRRARHL
jgi:hypothetical protein